MGSMPTDFGSVKKSHVAMLSVKISPRAYHARALRPARGGDLRDFGRWSDAGNTELQSGRSSGYRIDSPQKSGIHAAGLSPPSGGMFMKRFAPAG